MSNEQQVLAEMCDDFENYHCVEFGDYKVYMTCLKSLPCQHLVMINEEVRVHMSNPQIFRLMKKHNCCHQHFNNYS